MPTKLRLCDVPPNGVVPSAPVMTRMAAACVVTLIATLGLVGCGDPGDERMVVAFIYDGSPDDHGWTYAHELGRQTLAEQLGEAVRTTVRENVPDETGPARQAIDAALNGGAAMIVATSAGFNDAVVAAARSAGANLFELCAGSQQLRNLATYYGQIEQPRYLSGLVAGGMTATGTIGYVAAYPIPEVIRGINAFTLGLRLVDAEAVTVVAWTYAWGDRVRERAAAEILIDGGADVIAQHQDTTEPQIVARDRGKLGIGCWADMGQFVGDRVLTSAVFNWGGYYVGVAKAAIGNRWRSEAYWGGMADGVVGLAPFSPRVPADVRALVAAEQERILPGATTIFCGPIRDQQGAIRIPAGTCLTESEILAMDWFVEGVVGTIPDRS